VTLVFEILPSNGTSQLHSSWERVHQIWVFLWPTVLVIHARTGLADKGTDVWSAMRNVASYWEGRVIMSFLSPLLSVLVRKLCDQNLAAASVVVYVCDGRKLPLRAELQPHWHWHAFLTINTVSMVLFTLSQFTEKATLGVTNLHNQCAKLQMWHSLLRHDMHPVCQNPRQRNKMCTLHILFWAFSDYYALV